MNYRGFEITNFFGGYEVFSGTGNMRHSVGLFTPDWSFDQVKNAIDNFIQENVIVEVRA